MGTWPWDELPAPTHTFHSSWHSQRSGSDPGQEPAAFSPGSVNYGSADFISSSPLTGLQASSGSEGRWRAGCGDAPLKTLLSLTGHWSWHSMTKVLQPPSVSSRNSVTLEKGFWQQNWWIIKSKKTIQARRELRDHWVQPERWLFLQQLSQVFYELSAHGSQPGCTTDSAGEFLKIPNVQAVLQTNCIRVT